MSETAPISTPNILILDLKTSGLYLRNESIDSPQQPWAPYLAAMLCTEAGQVINHFSCYIKPEGRMVKGGALDKHGIDHKAAARLGVPEARALGLLSDLLKVGSFEMMKVVTFGDMDTQVISSLFARFAISQGKQPSAYDKLWFTRPLTKYIDLQKPFAQLVCKLESDIEGADFRWPTFREATEIVLGRSPAATTDSLQDILILKDLYFNFQQRGFFAEGAAA